MTQDVRDAEKAPAQTRTRLHTGLAAAGGAALAVAAGFAALIAVDRGSPPTLGADRDWLRLTRDARDPLLTEAAKVVSLIGGPTGGTVIVAVVAVFLWFARKRRAGAVYLAAILALTSGLSQLIKHLVVRARPPGALVAADVGSFPSGHVITTLAVGLALVLVLARPGKRRVPLIGVAVATLIMIWCRTYLGEHWLSDTLESILVAAGAVAVGWAVADPLVEREAAFTSTTPRPSADSQVTKR